MVEKGEYTYRRWWRLDFFFETEIRFSTAEGSRWWSRESIHTNCLFFSEIT